VKKLPEVIQISLAAARVNAKMTQEEAAKRMKIGKRTIINWEKGASIPSFSDMSMLSQIYGIPVDNIFLPEKST
jgi:DNA-binding XRE family transcriptional regulator